MIVRLPFDVVFELVFFSYLLTLNPSVTMYVSVVSWVVQLARQCSKGRTHLTGQLVFVDLLDARKGWHRCPAVSVALCCL